MDYRSNKLSPAILRPLVRAALAEDIGGGDATTMAVVPEEIEVAAALVTRQDCVCAGLPVLEAVFREIDGRCMVTALVAEGECCPARTELARINGPARAVLTGERTALNFMQRMTGIATLTRTFVNAASCRTQILDTRKTTPGLRVLEKYAVAVGGGTNHRFGLFDRIMIKDNHRRIAALEGPGSIARAVAACRRRFPNLLVEVEADTLEEVEQACEARADFILLDNMSDEEIAEAVELVEGRIPLEASGNVSLERVAALAAIGVDFISVGALTHSAPAIDLALDIEI